MALPRRRIVQEFEQELERRYSPLANRRRVFLQSLTYRQALVGPQPLACRASDICTRIALENLGGLASAW